LKNNSQLCPGKKAFIKNTKDLSHSLYRRLVARRARQLIYPALCIPTDEKKRRKHEKEIEKHFLEKIHLVKDFLPARFLVDGASKSNAVCRIVTSASLGTGFLIGRSFLMTNNHILSNSFNSAGGFRFHLKRIVGHSSKLHISGRWFYIRRKAAIFLTVLLLFSQI
jgi:hypothetical protein